MNPVNELKGQRFGELKVIKRAGTSWCGKAQWLVKCSCGFKKVVRGCNLVYGSTKSCGFRSRHG